MKDATRFFARFGQKHHIKHVLNNAGDDIPTLVRAHEHPHTTKQQKQKIATKLGLGIRKYSLVNDIYIIKAASAINAIKSHGYHVNWTNIVHKRYISAPNKRLQDTYHLEGTDQHGNVWRILQQHPEKYEYIAVNNMPDHHWSHYYDFLEHSNTDRIHMTYLRSFLNKTSS